MNAGPERAADRATERAAQIIRAATERKLRIATAESLTAGLVSATLADIPGASAALRGGVVAYANDVKEKLLGVPRDLLRREGSVHPDVAAAMAGGACARLEADVAISTTGVAGPDAHDGKPVGTVYIGVAWWVTKEVAVTPLKLTGDRASIRQASVEEALRILAGSLDIVD